MSTERDPELARTLERALASPAPRPGAERRIARHLDERLHGATRGWPLWAVLGACVLCVVAGIGLGARLVQPAALVATASAHSWLGLRTARAVLSRSANIQVERDDEHGTELSLFAGTALFHVQKGTGRSFVVNAGGARVEVVGTVFGVALEDGHASVEVLEGVVRLTKDGVTRTLRAGESAPAGVRLFTLAPDELLRLRAPVNVRGGAPGAPALSAASPSLPTAPAADSPSLPAAPAAAGLLPPKTRRPAPAPSAPRVAETASDSPAPPSAYQRARTLERDGALADAARAYAAVANAGGADAEDATFALARMPAERGDTNATLGAIGRYRAAFPAGRYARDIDVLELNAHLAAHDDAAALRDAEQFLAHFANDARAWRFRLVRADSRARAGDCDGARSDLERVPGGAAKSAVLARCGDAVP